MKVLYVTDLHGCEWKYKWLFEAAKEFQVDMVINGGDMLPKTQGELFRQGEFIEGFLTKHFSQFNSNKIHYLCCLGNDDLRIFDEQFRETCNKYPYVFDLSQRKFNIYQYEFIGFNSIVDCPFRIKDRCRMDTLDYKLQKQYGEGLLSTPQGYMDINNWPLYAKSIDTIKEELTDLVWPKNMSNTIYVMHQPPTHMGLDTCYDGREVGSEAIYSFLKTNQPKMSLHGHIHESSEVTGMWRGKIGNTICIQPGQLDPFTFVIIELPSGKTRKYTE